MANLAITDEANRVLDRYVDASEHGATKKAVASSLIIDALGEEDD
jgi:hypothetical protein